MRRIDESLQRDVVRGISVFTVIRGIGIPGFMYLFPLYLLTLGYHTADLGPLATYSAIATALSLPLIGYITDRGYAAVIGVSSGILISLSLAMPVLWRGYWELVAAYFLNYLGMMSWQLSRGSLTAKVVKISSLGKYFGLYTMLYNSMNIVTPLALGLALTSTTYEVLLIILSLLVASGSAIFAIMVLKPAGIVEYALRSEAINRWGEVWRGCSYLGLPRKILCIYGKALIVERRLIPLVLFGVFDRYGWMLWMPMLNAYLKEYLGLTPTLVGIYNTLRGVAMLAAALPVGHITDKLGGIRSLIINEVLGASGTLLLMTGSTILIYTSAFLIGWSIAFWIVGYNTISAVLMGPQNLGRVRSSVDSLRTFAAIPAPAIGSSIFTLLNPASVFLTGAFFMMLAIAPLIASLRGVGNGHAQRGPNHT